MSASAFAMKSLAMEQSHRAALQTAVTETRKNSRSTKPTDVTGRFPTKTQESTGPRVTGKTPQRDRDVDPMACVFCRKIQRKTYSDLFIQNLLGTFFFIVLLAQYISLQ